MKLVSIDNNEIRTSGMAIHEIEDYGFDDLYGENNGYDDFVRSEVSLNGLIGHKKIDDKTIRLEFNDGDIVNVNVKPSKMNYVLSQIKNNRRAKVTVKCY